MSLPHKLRDILLLAPRKDGGNADSKEPLCQHWPFMDYGYYNFFLFVKLSGIKTEIIIPQL